MGIAEWVLLAYVLIGLKIAINTVWLASYWRRIAAIDAKRLPPSMTVSASIFTSAIWPFLLITEQRRTGQRCPPFFRMYLFQWPTKRWRIDMRHRIVSRPWPDGVTPLQR